MSENYLYILMRTDLPSMGPGRAAAQASHASNAFWHKYGKTKEAQAWAASTKQGFGTAIVLGATLEQIKERCGAALTNKFAMDTITDTDYAISFSAELLPYMRTQSELASGNATIEQSEKDPNKYILHRQEVTCAYIFGDKEALQPILGDLPLYS
jgi:peptidyl-tRNA hydrolase